MKIQTHGKIDQTLCGTPVSVGNGKSRLEFTASGQMQVDASGLVHGGFIFGLADHAAMVAVNHPNVVLGAAEVRFVPPVKANERLVAEAATLNVEGKKHTVSVIVTSGEKKVFSGQFVCFVLDQHVLS